MTDFDTLDLRVDDRGIATLALDRPNKHNALNAQLIGELTEAAVSLAADTSVRAVVLTGHGVSFCAGGDLGWMRNQLAKNRSEKLKEARALVDMFLTLSALPKPLIGRINGPAYGGGLGLISACDRAHALPGTRFGLTETRRGLVPATIGPFVCDRMGHGFARQVFFSGQFFDADMALRSGLITSATNDLDAAIETDLKGVLASAPGAVAAAKALCRKLSGKILDEHVDLAVNALADCWESAEGIAGITAFFASEKPPWAIDD